jgi:hypothetical protein
VPTLNDLLSRETPSRASANPFGLDYLRVEKIAMRSFDVN